MKLSRRVWIPAVPVCASIMRLRMGTPCMQRMIASSVMESGPQGNALIKMMPSIRSLSMRIEPMSSRLIIHGMVDEKSRLALYDLAWSVSQAKSGMHSSCVSERMMSPAMY